MYAEVHHTPSRAADANGKGYAGAKWYFYAAGTTTPQAVYTTPALTTAHANPVVADGGGLFPAIYFDPSLAYRGVCRNANGSVTLHDFDPVNPALLAELAGAGGAARIGFLQSGTGATTRTVQAKLLDDPVDVRDFGELGTANDAPVFAAAYAAAKAASRPLRLPAGTFLVSGLTFDGTIPVSGAGPANTVFKPTGPGQTVITLTDNTTGFIDRGDKAWISDFSVDLSGATGCTAIYSNWLVRSVIERISVSGSEFDSFAGGNVGWRIVGDQFCTYRDIHIERLTHGVIFTNDATRGGGNNNLFAGLAVAYCKFNLMIFRSATFPMGSNQFDNIRLQACRHCGLYINDVQGLSFSMLSPEEGSGSAAVLTAQGQTVKKASIHAVNNAQAQFTGYWHAQSLASDMPIIAEDNSTLRFDASLGSAVQTFADRSSSIRWEGNWGQYSTFRNSEVSLQTFDAPRMFAAYHPAAPDVTPGFPNEVPDPVSVPIAGQIGATNRLCADAIMGPVREVTFLPTIGNLNANMIALSLGASPYGVSDVMWCSVLLWSDRDTQVRFDFAQASSVADIDLRAGEWTRLITGNANTAGLTRNPHLIVFPTGPDAPVLRFAMPVALRNPTAQQARMLSERHLFNPRDPAGAVLRLSAPPAMGSWLVGSEVLNSTPTAGTAPGWTCVSAGTPGVWKAQAPLAA